MGPTIRGGTTTRGGRPTFRLSDNLLFLLSQRPERRGSDSECFLFQQVASEDRTGLLYHRLPTGKHTNEDLQVNTLTRTYR